MVTCETRSPNQAERAHISSIIEGIQCLPFPRRESFQLLGMVVLTLVAFFFVIEVMGLLFGNFGVFIVGTPFCLWVMIVGHDYKCVAFGHPPLTRLMPQTLRSIALQQFLRWEMGRKTISLRGLLRDGDMHVVRVQVTSGYAFIMGDLALYFFALQDGRTLYYTSHHTEFGTWPSDVFDILVGYHGDKAAYRGVCGVGDELMSLEIFYDPEHLARLENFINAAHRPNEHRFHDGAITLHLFDDSLDVVYERYLREATNAPSDDG